MAPLELKHSRIDGLPNVCSCQPPNPGARCSRSGTFTAQIRPHRDHFCIRLRNVPADDVRRRGPTEQAHTANPSRNAEHSSSSPKMCTLLDIIASSLGRDRFNQGIGMAGLLLCMGLLLLRVAKTTALVLQESVYSCVPAVLRTARG